MYKHEAPSPVDLSLFSPDRLNPEAKYGLPQEIKFCRRCVMSNQRPCSAVEFRQEKNQRKTTIAFDEAGICSACRVAEQKNHHIDWAERDAMLRELCDRHRSKDGSYDCIVPGSGGKDSFYAAHVLKYKYNMNPLTVTWAPNIYTDWGWKNFQAWIHAGFTNILYTPNGRVHRLLTRLATENLLHPFQAFILGQKALAPKMAISHKIPLVFYGENEAEYGNPIATNSSTCQDKKFFSADDKNSFVLGGTGIQELREEYGLKEADLDPYIPADPQAVSDLNLEVHYLGYYLKWHLQGAYYYSVEHGGFQCAPERTAGTYSKYNSIDDKLDDLHYYTTMIKFGYGRATVDAVQEIRSGDITREEGIALVRRYDGEFPQRFADEIFKYLSLPEQEYPAASRNFEHPMMNHEYFDQLCNKFRSPHVWKYENGKWLQRHASWHSANEMKNYHFQWKQLNTTAGETQFGSELSPEL